MNLLDLRGINLMIWSQKEENQDNIHSGLLWSYCPNHFVITAVVAFYPCSPKTDF